MQPNDVDGFTNSGEIDQTALGAVLSKSALFAMKHLHENLIAKFKPDILFVQTFYKFSLGREKEQH